MKDIKLPTLEKLNNEIGESLVVDEPYSHPLYNELDIDYNKFPYEPKNKEIQAIIGAKIRVDGHGDLIGIETTKGIKLITNIEDLINWISFFDGYIFVFEESWELDPIIKMFGGSVCVEVLSNGRASYKDVQLWFAPSRSLTLKVGKVTCRFQTIIDWCKGKSIVETLQSLGITATGLKGIQELAELLLKTNKTVWGKQLNSISSPSIITSMLLNRMYEGTSIARIPKEVVELAYSCFHAPWLEQFKTGYTENLYAYDINSAYPSTIKDLIGIDANCGKWHYSEEYVETAHYGFCIAKIKISSKVKISPILVRKHGSLFSPTGEWIGYITKEEIDFIAKFKLGEVEIVSGWWFIPDALVHPYLSIANKISQIRQLAKDTNNIALNYSVKLASVRLVGKFLQRYSPPLSDSAPIASATFNPIYAAIVMTRVKLKIAELALTHPDNVVSVIVDSVTFDKKIEFPSSGKFGEVRLINNEPQSKVILSPTIPNYNKVMEEIVKDPTKSRYSIPVDQFNRLCNSIQKKEFHKTGTYEKSGFIFDVGKDHKRSWVNAPKFGFNLLHKNYASVPKMIDELELTYPSMD